MSVLGSVSENLGEKSLDFGFRKFGLENSEAEWQEKQKQKQRQRGSCFFCNDIDP